MPLLRVIQHQIARLGQWALNILRTWTKPYAQTLIVGVVTDKRDLMLKNALLRQQLIVVKCQVKRLRLTWRERALLVVLTSRLKTWQTVNGYFLELVKAVMWQSINKYLRRKVRQQAGREAKFAVVIVNSLSVKTTEKRRVLRI